jgi:hypothetical protein
MTFICSCRNNNQPNAIYPLGTCAKESASTSLDHPCIRGVAYFSSGGGGGLGNWKAEPLVRSSCLMGNTDIPGITDIHVYKGRKYFFGFRV